MLSENENSLCNNDPKVCVLKSCLCLLRISGQVGVATDKSAKQWQGMLDSMFSDFSEEYRDTTSDVLTAKQSKHYWAKAMPETSRRDSDISSVGVTTSYHEFKNKRYLGVTQDVKVGDEDRWWTQCFRYLVHNVYIPHNM